VALAGGKMAGMNIWDVSETFHGGEH